MRQGTNKFWLWLEVDGVSDPFLYVSAIEPEYQCELGRSERYYTWEAGGQELAVCTEAVKTVFGDWVLELQANQCAEISLSGAVDIWTASG